jgi:hypothetical protein
VKHEIGRRLANALLLLALILKKKPEAALPSTRSNTSPSRLGFQRFRTSTARAFNGMLREFFPRVPGQHGRESEVLFGQAVPFNEPIVAHGPFVMNTRDEIVAT